METIVESSAAVSVASLLGTGKSSSLGEALKVIESHVANQDMKSTLTKITRSAYGRVVKRNDVDRFSLIVTIIKNTTSPQNSIITRLLLSAYLQNNNLAEEQMIVDFLPTAQILLQ